MYKITLKTLNKIIKNTLYVWSVCSGKHSCICLATTSVRIRNFAHILKIAPFEMYDLSENLASYETHYLPDRPVACMERRRFCKVATMTSMMTIHAVAAVHTLKRS